MFLLGLLMPETSFSIPYLFAFLCLLAIEHGLIGGIIAETVINRWW